MRFFNFVAAMALLGGTTSLQARNWPDAGGWEVFEVSADTCGMAMEYEGKGETMLMLLLGADGKIMMSVGNYAWTTVPDQKYELAYYLNGTVYEGGASVGIHTGARKGFVTTFAPDFLRHFQASSKIWIRGDKGVLIDSLTLVGSGAGLAQVRRCVAHLKAIASAAARKKARFAHIPDDPFAQLRGEGPPKPGQPVPVVALASLVRSDDYPESAIQNEEQGTVAYRLTVGSTGRITNCLVTNSSGSRSLDAATCRIMQSRARFTPARSAGGSATMSTYESSIGWILREPVPPPPATTPQ